MLYYFKLLKHAVLYQRANFVGYLKVDKTEYYMQFDTQTSSKAKFIIFVKTIFVTGLHVIYLFNII